jgi:hypothetical protein
VRGPSRVVSREARFSAVMSRIIDDRGPRLERHLARYQAARFVGTRGPAVTAGTVQLRAVQS